jgi:long-chain acyl-CoA synthetase
MLQFEPEIGQAMVIGDKQPYLVGLIVPDADAARDWAKSLGKPADLASAVADPRFHAYIEDVVDRVNKRLGQPERLRRFALVAEPFTTDNAMLTPSMKIRRHVISAAYAEQLAALRR